MIPSSTYRLQLHAAFTLRDALAAVPYLAQLGIHWIYCSPLFMSRPGSEHGYDVVDPTRIDPELGTEQDMERLVQALHDHGLGLLLDVVPNHMGAHEANSWWMDVLEYGQSSAYARYFDVDWKAGAGKLLLPILGSDLDEVLDGGELKVEHDGQRHWLTYYENRFPLLVEEGTSVTPGALTRETGLPLLERQSYRLMRWSARRALNYRRFFEINDLVGVRVEDPIVFETIHATLFEWIARGWVDGLRIDHPDGLRDPATYLRSLAHAAACALAQRPDAQVEATSPDQPYIVVEKILTGRERLPTSWPVRGTTGYEQLNLLADLLVDAEGAAAVERIYRQMTEQRDEFEELAYTSKKQVLQQRFTVELSRLRAQLSDLFASTPEQPSVEPATLAAALLELVTCFPVYRTYVSPADVSVSGEDRKLFEAAFTAATARAPEIPSAVMAGLRSVCLLEPPIANDPDRLASCREFVLRLQQLTGPAAAKGVEDTALYRYVPLASQNEVGGEPRGGAVSLAEFHELNEERARIWPHALTATSTHDTKRSEDTRARIAALSEIPEQWAAALKRFQEQNRAHKLTVDGALAPTLNDEYLFYETLIGVWPDGGRAAAAQVTERVRDYMLKAAREAKLMTSWTDQNEAYENALTAFVGAVLERADSEFLRDFERFVTPIVRAGRLSSLAQLVVKLGCPGVPDFYQGTELWDLSLVDPDNRRPVDFERRLALLGGLEDLELGSPHLDEAGTHKLLVTARGLATRARLASLFGTGEYVALPATGQHAQRVVAFARTQGDRAVLFVTGRYFMGFGERYLGAAWENTQLELPARLRRGRYRDALTGEVQQIQSSALELARVFGVLPCAILECVE